MSHDPEVKAMLTECHRILKTLEEQTARAAAQFPAWAFWLVWRKAGTWQQQRILA